MIRQNPPRQPPSPPMSNNGEVSIGRAFAATEFPYTPPKSVGQGPVEYLQDSRGGLIRYAVPTPSPQQSTYHTPQPTFIRLVRSRPDPPGTRKFGARDGQRPSQQNTRPTSHRATSSRKRKGGHEYNFAGDGLPGPLSEITKDYDIPVRDMEAWVNRPLAQRMNEMALKNGHIARPMNSFMLYRSAYAERVKQYCRENNHQVVSKVTGNSWPLESAEVREYYTNLAALEKENHQAAHPDYKFTPNKTRSGKKRARDVDDDDSDSDGEWKARTTKRTRASLRQERRNTLLDYPRPEIGTYAVMQPSPQPHPSSYQASNPHQLSASTYDPVVVPGHYYHAGPLPYGPDLSSSGFGGIGSEFSEPLYPNVENGLIGMPDGDHGLLYGPEYGPGYDPNDNQYSSSTGMRFIDPELEHPDGTYTYEHEQAIDDFSEPPRDLVYPEYSQLPAMQYDEYASQQVAMQQEAPGVWDGEQYPRIHYG